MIPTLPSSPPPAAPEAPASANTSATGDTGAEGQSFADLLQHLSAHPHRGTGGPEAAGAPAGDPEATAEETGAESGLPLALVGTPEAALVAAMLRATGPTVVDGTTPTAESPTGGGTGDGIPTGLSGSSVLATANGTAAAAGTLDPSTLAGRAASMTAGSGAATELAGQTQTTVDGHVVATVATAPDADGTAPTNPAPITTGTPPGAKPAPITTGTTTATTPAATADPTGTPATADGATGPATPSGAPEAAGSAAATAKEPSPAATADGGATETELATPTGSLDADADGGGSATDDRHPGRPAPTTAKEPSPAPRVDVEQASATAADDVDQTPAPRTDPPAATSRTEAPAGPTPVAAAPVGSTPTTARVHDPAPPPPPAPAPEPQIVHQQIVRRISDLRELTDGRRELTLDLEPAELGRVRIELVLHKGVLDIRFDAQHAVTRDLLGDSLGDLRDALARAGVDAGDVDVHSGSREGADHDGGDRPARGDTTAIPSTDDQSPTGRRLHSDAALDVLL